MQWNSTHDKVLRAIKNKDMVEPELNLGELFKGTSPNASHPFGGVRILINNIIAINILIIIIIIV